MARKKAARKKAEWPVVDVLAAISDDSVRRVEDMEEVEYFPTVLTGYNRASGIGGLARGKIMIVHGPNQVGKSVFAMALGLSAYGNLHSVAIQDTERAAEKEWYSSIVPKAKLDYPVNLDGMRDNINDRIGKLMSKKKSRKKDEQILKRAGCFEIVDTITKLMPKNIVEKVEKEGIDKMFPIQALWISTWMKEIVIKLDESMSTLVLVLQERKNLDQFSRKTWSLPGGQSLKYDNCLRVRVTHCKKVEQKKQVVGVQSFYKVENNKIDGTTFEEGSFFTSNGKGDMPKGLDLVRECIAELRQRKHTIQSGDYVRISMPRLDGFDPMIRKVKGGWEDLRLRLVKDSVLFDEIVERLNLEVRR